MTEAPDHLTYTFKLRQGVRFHNGKEMTSADVVASFDRYAKIGLQRSMLNNVASWDAPDKDTFVIHMKKAQPTFLEALSARSACRSSSFRPRTRTTRRMQLQADRHRAVAAGRVACRAASSN